MMTIFAVSSGAPPAAIGVIRISGPQSAFALETLTGRSFVERRASVARLRDEEGGVLDEAVVLWFRGPRSSTGEDCVELHCHGGRAVLHAVCSRLGRIEGLRPAEAGEFTRRAFANGRVDLAEAEGLADLLEAETELQRASAILAAGGALSGEVEALRDAVLAISAEVEAVLDFSDEDDVNALPVGFADRLDAVSGQIESMLARPRSEKLKEGIRVVLAGPPNAGKSTLFNALVESEAAITSPTAGTTRDVIERSSAISGVPFTFVDTAGLRDNANDGVERIGIERAQGELDRADIVLWLGPEGEGPDGCWEVSAQSDTPEFVAKQSEQALEISAVTGAGIGSLKLMLVDAARSLLPKPGEQAVNARQLARLVEAGQALGRAREGSDLLLVAEDLRAVRVAFDRLTGRATTEDMLDALFGRFCIGK